MMRNSLKAKLLCGGPAFGVSVMIPSPQIVEMLGRLGFDWVLIDCEHGTISLESVELMTMAAQLCGITPIVRPLRNSPEEISRVMDRGALGVQIPHVKTAVDARRAVESVKYYPIGSRSLAAGTRPAEYGFGLQAAQYVEQANHESLVVVQIEDTEAVANIEEILTVREVDVFFVGPSDLSQSMGFPGRTDSPEVADTIVRLFTAIVAAGRIPGSAGGAYALGDYLDHGCRYLYTHLPRLLQSASADFLAAVKGAT